MQSLTRKLQLAKQLRQTRILALLLVSLIYLLSLVIYPPLAGQAKALNTIPNPSTVQSPNQQVQLLAHIGGPFQRVLMQREYTYVATQFSVSIFNTSNPTQPQRLGEILLPWLKDIAIAGNTLYATLWEDAKLAVIDITDRSNPRQIAVVDLPGLPDGMVLNGEMIYILSFLEGGQVINIANPAQAQIVGNFSQNTSLRRGVMRNQLLYVVSNNALRIFTTASGQPELKGETFFFASEIRSLHLHGNLAYAVQFDKTFVFDVSDMSAPKLVTTLSLGEVLTITDNYLYAQNRMMVDSHPVEIYSLTDPLQPVQVATMPFDYFVSEIKLNGQQAGFATDGGLFLVDLRNPLSPHPQSRWWGGSDVRQAEVVGNYLYLRDGLHEEMALIDIANPRSPTPVTTLNVISRSEGLKVDGNLVYVGRDCTFPCRSGFTVHSRLNPLTLDAVGSYGTPVSGLLFGGPVQSFATAGNLAYVATTGSGMRAVDMSDPMQPVDLGGYKAYLSDLHVRGNFLFGIHLQGFQNELQVINISDPAQPTLAASFPISNGHAFDMQAQRIYIADRDHAAGLAGLRIIDIADPTQPKQIGQFLFEPARNAQAVAVDGKLAYVGVEHTGSGIDTIRVIDISDPEQLQEIDRFELSGPRDSGFSLAEVRDVTSHNGILYVSEEQGGIFLFAYPSSNGVDSRIEAPDMIQVPPDYPATIPVVINNSGILTTTQLSITVTLADGVSYVGSTLGEPALQSDLVLLWLVDGLPPFAPIQMNLQVSLPSGRQAGARYPITVEVATADEDARPTNNRLEIVLQSVALPVPTQPQLYLPLVTR